MPPLVDERPPTLVLVDEDDALTCAAEHVDHFEAFQRRDGRPRARLPRVLAPQPAARRRPSSRGQAQVDADEAAVDAILAPARRRARNIQVLS